MPHALPAVYVSVYPWVCVCVWTKLKDLAEFPHWRNVSTQ